MQTSEQINEIAAALAKAQGKIQPASKDASNPAFKRGNQEMKYATLASVWEACRAALTENAIAVVQSPGTDDSGAVTMTTMLCHSSGQWMRSEMGVRPAKADAQGAGSVITYLRRYALAAMVGVAPDDDDDGNAASGTMTPAGRSQPPKTQAAPPPATPFDDRPSMAIKAKSKEEWLAIFKSNLDAAKTDTQVRALEADNRAALDRLPKDDADELGKLMAEALTRLLAEAA